MFRHTPKLNIKKANYPRVSTEIFSIYAYRFDLRRALRTKTQRQISIRDLMIRSLLVPHTMADTLLKGVASHKS